MHPSCGFLLIVPLKIHNKSIRWWSYSYQEQ